jgi:hypothetical protein
MCDRLKLNLGSFCHFDEERLAFEGPCRLPGHQFRERVVVKGGVVFND